MARVTKINVGGTNYDIAHEGELKNSGFEVVTELPTTGLFEGRQVLYQNRVWVYSNGWVSPNNPVSFPKGVTLQSSTEALTAAARYIELQNFQLAQVPELLNKSLFISNNDNCVKQSDRLYELIDNETGTITVKTGIVQPVLGQTLRYTAINPSYDINELSNRTSLNNNSTNAVYCVYIPQNLRREKAIYKIEYYVYSNATGDGDTNNKDNYEWKTVFEKELGQRTVMLYPLTCTVYFKENLTYTYIYNIRVSITPTTKNNAYNIIIRDIDIKYFASYHRPLIYANRLINYDAVIEPTQTSEVMKPIPWILQYLTQGVNWLKANDNTKLDKRAYNHIYTNRGYVNFGANVATGALIIELPFAPYSDFNNSMTFIELNIYSHRKGCSKYIIGVYSYSQNSNYDWSVYSYMGYNYFSKISFGRRVDNNNIVVVLGDFTDLHKNEHFSISHIITGFNRNNDDTDGFLLYTDSDSNNYNTLISSTYISPIISYNDLTDRPTLATVATSGSYNDLTDNPTLATVATSGSYNDLTDNPTQLPNPNPIIIKTADGVSVRYDGSTSGGVTLEAGNNAELTATQDSDDTMTVKFGAIVPQTLPNPNALNIMVLDSEGALLGPSIVYDGVATKHIELIEGYGIKLSNSNLSIGQAITINLKQIAGTTLLGNANDTTGIPQAVTMTQLRTMLGSLTLNDIDVTLGGNNSYTLPWYVDYNGVDYPARIRDHWLQIYRNGIWTNLMYLGDILPTQVGQITSLDNLDWYNEQVSEYEVDSTTTTSILNGTTKPATLLLNCLAEQLTLNLYPISGKQYGKGSLDSLISDLQGKEFSVFVENDLDTILASGSDYLVRIKISKVPTPKAIIECYVAR